MKNRYNSKRESNRISISTNSESMKKILQVPTRTFCRHFFPPLQDHCAKPLISILLTLLRHFKVIRYHILKLNGMPQIEGFDNVYWFIDLWNCICTHPHFFRHFFVLTTSSWFFRFSYRKVISETCTDELSWRNSYRPRLRLGP